MAGINTKPVTSVPVIAPAVLTAYNRLTLDPLASAALSNGSVMPIMAVGTTRIANEQTSRAMVSSSSESGAAR